MEPCRSQVRDSVVCGPLQSTMLASAIASAPVIQLSVSACFWSDGLLGHQIRSEWNGWLKSFVACPGQVGWFGGYEQRGVWREQTLVLLHCDAEHKLWLFKVKRESLRGMGGHVTPMFRRLDPAAWQCLRRCETLACYPLVKRRGRSLPGDHGQIITAAQLNGRSEKESMMMRCTWQLASVRQPDDVP
jgi:hypothetical protein